MCYVGAIWDSIGVYMADWKTKRQLQQCLGRKLSSSQNER